MSSRVPHISFGLRDYGVNGQIGLEASPDAYVAQMVWVFREVRRVLREDGTCWVNLGDSYAGSWGNQGRKPERGTQRPINGAILTPVLDGRYPAKESNTGKCPPGLKPKDLIGIPWRVAFALQADGWYLRSDVIWSKLNPMPESVTDRPTKSHEYVFLLAKSERYFYDAEAVSEAAVCAGDNPIRVNAGASEQAADPQRFRTRPSGRTCGYPDRRNLRSVWPITTQDFPGSHFATMPLALAERCIKAGCPKSGVVIDPFGGSGTTAVVATGLRRRAIIMDLNPQYAAMAKRRIERPHAKPERTSKSDDSMPLFSRKGTEGEQDAGFLD